MRVHSPISINFSSSTNGSSVKLRGKGFASGEPIAGIAQVANIRFAAISGGLASGTPLPGSVHAATVRLAARSQLLLASFNSHIALLL